MMVVVTTLHLLQVTLWGAYRKPRELNWWIGLVMMACLFGFALTGYLLPWDQKGYWATQVATSLIGATPLVGPWLRSVVQGGPEYGNLTLTHFYALHVIVLPAALVALVVAHVALFRKHGVTPRWNADESVSEPFWPGQLVRDLGAMAVVLALMFVMAARRHGVELEAPADPSSSYDARPEWYFYPLFQLLKFFPGRWELVGAMGAPLVAAGVLFALPLLDRGRVAQPVSAQALRRRGAAAAGGRGGAGRAGQLADARNPAYQKFRLRADRRRISARCDWPRRACPQPAGWRSRRTIRWRAAGKSTKSAALAAIFWTAKASGARPTSTAGRRAPGCACSSRRPTTIASTARPRFAA